MDFQEFKDVVCRICLDESAVLDWNATLYGYCGITYRDLFYKYTHLEPIVADEMSNFLCQTCVDSLYKMHTFILKAVESNKFFEDIKYTPKEFETVLMEKIEVEPILEHHFIYEHSDEESINNSVNMNDEKCSKPYSARGQREAKRNIRNTRKYPIDLDTKTNCSEYNAAVSFNLSTAKSLREKCRKTIEDINNIEITLGNEIHEGNEAEQIPHLEVDNVASSTEQSERKIKKRYKEIKSPRICSICSKIFYNKHSVETHEKTHMENRERKEICKICGLKFYDKKSLYSHKLTHKENREKIHKCEFCNKAFYNKGALNIHRRIHLGQMVPCSLCEKEFFRKIDLDRHMSSHSATAINSEMKKRSRYFVRCKYCDKSMLSTSFKSHTAAHLNEPLMRCSICSKEYFRRESCVLHLKKTHQKNNNYNDFIIQLKNNRMSHLFLEQTADIQITDV